MSAAALAHYAPMADAAEMQRLAFGLADSAARSAIECYCDRTDSTSPLYDAQAMEPDLVEVVTEALRYLRLRGLIEDAGNGFVRFVERAL